MGSVYRDRFDDSRTSVSSARRDGGYTTVKRYIVKEDDRDSRSSVGRARSFVPERGGERVEETRIIRREREVEEPVREIRREEPRVQERSELMIRRERDESPRARSVIYDSRREEPAQDRELVIRRTTERDEPRRDDFEVARYEDRKVVDTHYRDGYEVLSPRGYDDRDVQKYSRTTDFFAPAPPPQTIIIRQEPIIIRERVRDEDYQIVRKSDIDEERSIVRARDPPPRGPRGEEDFFYEKKVRERIDDRDRRGDDDEYYERRTRRHSVSPHDSVSQRGRNYSSDDSMVYVRKETTREVSASPDRKRGLAAGVLAGVGAAELLRNHKRKDGQDVSHGVGRVGRDIGAGALGALAAEGIHRARSMHRSRSRRRDSRSRSRSRSDSRSRRRRNRSRSRSRSRSSSPSKLKALGTVGLGAAALAAVATIASKRMNKNKEEDDKRGRSRSRSRTGRRAESVDSLENDPDAPSDDARNPKHRRSTIAKAGAGGAVVAALIEHARNKSRNRDGKERSRSRIRQALPVIAAGLGSAAVAGVYEKHKAKKEAEEIVEKNRRARSRSKSRARSEHTAYYDGPGLPAPSEQGLVEYGNQPMYGNNYGPDYYGRPPPQEGYYSGAVVPAAPVAAAAYGAQRSTRSRSRSLSRDRGGRRDRSSSSSPDRHGRRGSRDAAKMTAAAAAGAIGATEYDRKQERRDRRARRRQQQEGYGRDPYDDNYNPGGQYAPTPPPPGNDPYATQQGFYPQTSQFPPPPGSIPQHYPAAAQVPSSTAPQGAAPYAQQGYPPPPPPPSAPPAPMSTYDAYASGALPYAPRGPENVSAEPSPAFGNSFAPVNDPFNDQNHVVGGLSRSVATPTQAPPPIPSQSPFYEPPFPPQPPFSAAPIPPPASSYEVPIPPPTSSSVPPFIPPVSSYEPPLPDPPPPIHTARQDTYPSPTTREVSPPRSQSQPPSSHRKSVQFAEKPQFSEAAKLESEVSSADRPRERHKHSHSRGYEAGDDTDSTPDEQRRGSRDMTSRSLQPESAEPGRRRHRRRRSHEPSLSRDEPSSSSRPLERDRGASPDSDGTIDLPARFDDKGRKKTEQGDDPLADRLDEILSGRGAAGKVFGNFLDGFFGPDGRKKKGK